MCLCACLPGSALRDPAKGGGPKTRLAVPAGQPAGHAQLPAAPRGREGAHLPRGEGEEPDRIHTQLQQHAAEIHPGQPADGLKGTRSKVSLAKPLSPTNVFLLIKEHLKGEFGYLVELCADVSGGFRALQCLHSLQPTSIVEQALV